jgi:hypothetical protein
MDAASIPPPLPNSRCLLGGLESDRDCTTLFWAIAATGGGPSGLVAQALVGHLQAHVMDPGPKLTQGGARDRRSIGRDEGVLEVTVATTMLTSDAQRSCLATRRAHGASSRNRRDRLRAALLAVAWMLPGVWCAAHVLAHVVESDHHEFHLAVSASAGIPAMSCDHDHSHSHPEVSPVLSIEGAKKFDTPRLLSGVVEVECSNPTLLSQADTALGYAARRAAAVSGPRAPPIS